MIHEYKLDENELETNFATNALGKSNHYNNYFFNRLCGYI